MGIKDILRHLPGGGPECYHHSFYESQLKEEIAIPFDAAGALWQFAASHAAGYLRGNHTPSLVEWTRLLNYLRSICKWRLIVYMDGRENVHKSHENQCRQLRTERALEQNNLRGQIRNTPEYIAKAVEVCKFLL